MSVRSNDRLAGATPSRIINLGKRGVQCGGENCPSDFTAFRTHEPIINRSISTCLQSWAPGSWEDLHFLWNFATMWALRTQMNPLTAGNLDRLHRGTISGWDSQTEKGGINGKSLQIFRDQKEIDQCWLKWGAGCKEVSAIYSVFESFEDNAARE